MNIEEARKLLEEANNFKQTKDLDDFQDLMKTLQDAGFIIVNEEGEEEIIFDDILAWANSSKAFQAYQIFGMMFIGDDDNKIVEFTEEEKEQILDYFSNDDLFDPNFIPFDAEDDED